MLLSLLGKFIAFEGQLQQDHRITFTANYYKRMTTIKTVYKQQDLHFKAGNKIENRIMSIAKSYLRPKIRGKEVKPVEFGTKLNKLQIDGINFIEHSIQRRHTLAIHRFTKPKVAPEKSYRYWAQMPFIRPKIRTDFKRKQRPPKNHKEEKALKTLLIKERATRLEGSFGKEKKHYQLQKK